MLKVNKTLAHLDLSGNNLRSISVAECVFEGLQQNTTLTYLNFKETGMTEEGEKCIAQAFKSSSSLHTLDFSTNFQDSLETKAITNS